MTEQPRYGEVYNHQEHPEETPEFRHLADRKVRNRGENSPGNRIIGFIGYVLVGVVALAIISLIALGVVSLWRAVLG